MFWRHLRQRRTPGRFPKWNGSPAVPQCGQAKAMLHLPYPTGKCKMSACSRHMVRAFDGSPLAGRRLVRIVYLDESGTSRREPLALVAGVVVDADNQLSPSKSTWRAWLKSTYQKRTGKIFPSMPLTYGAGQNTTRIGMLGLSNGALMSSVTLSKYPKGSICRLYLGTALVMNCLPFHQVSLWVTRSAMLLFIPSHSCNAYVGSRHSCENVGPKKLRLSLWKTAT